MQLNDALRALRRGWHIVLGTIACCLALAWALTQLMDKEYEATSQLFVSTSGSAQDSQALLQGSNFTQQRVKSYAEAIGTPYILEDVIKEVGLDASPAGLARNVEAEVPLETVLIDVTVTQSDPQRAADVANAIGQVFTKKVPLLETTAGAKSPVKVTVVREATPSQVPSSPLPLINLVLGGLLGAVLGVAAALLRQLLDTSLRNEQDVREVTDEVVIGTLHMAKESKSGPLVMRHSPLSPDAESFRTLRTNLQFIDAAHDTKSFVMTSSVPGEGKSTVTANLALALSEIGASVCVVEADLRRPRLLDYMSLASGAGLTNLLIGNADLEDVLQPFGENNVMAIGAGPVPPNPSELLGSPAMGTVVTQLAGMFDYVLYDAPPLLPVTDAAVLGRQVDGVAIVVGAGVGRKEQLRKTLDLLGNVGADVLGLVLNRLPAKGPDAYSYYRAGYEADPVHDPNAPRSTSRWSRNGKARARR